MNNAPISLLETSTIELFTPIRRSLALALIASCYAGDLDGAQKLVAEQADAWLQDDEGSSALHAAACKCFSTEKTESKMDADLALV